MFHIIFESSPEAIALTRVRDGAIVQVNREWESMTGYRREEVVGRTALALGHWLHPEQRTSIFGNLKPGGRVMDVDVSLVMKGGSPRVVRLNATMLMEAGEAYILIYLRDVTADLLAREALRSGELALANANTVMNRQVKLHELTESVAQVGYWVNYPGDKTVYLSPGLAQIAGLEQEAVVTMDMLWAGVSGGSARVAPGAPSDGRRSGGVPIFRPRRADTVGAFPHAPPSGGWTGVG